jgi:hypothetical protein
MPAAPVTTPADPVAATRRKLARLLAVGAIRAAAGKDRQHYCCHPRADGARDHALRSDPSALPPGGCSGSR